MTISSSHLHSLLLTVVVTSFYSLTFIIIKFTTILGSLVGWSVVGWFPFYYEHTTDPTTDSNLGHEEKLAIKSCVECRIHSYT